MSLRSITCVAALIFGLASASQAAIVFDDFNSSLGHFTSGVTNASSGSNTGSETTSTNTRDTTTFEGTASDKLTLVHDTTTNAWRIRHLSGAGTPANNTQFATSSGTDGWIGFYLKTTASG